MGMTDKPIRLIRASAGISIAYRLSENRKVWSAATYRLLCGAYSRRTPYVHTLSYRKNRPKIARIVYIVFW